MSIIKKLNNKDLSTVINLLKKSRTALVNSYIEKDNDRYHYSFKYYKYTETLKIVSNLLEHQWIDTQVNLYKEKFEAHEISLNCFQELLSIFKVYMAGNIKDDFLSETIIANNQTKIKALESLLSIKDDMDKKSRLLLFDYHRDKMLYEKEMEYYEKEIRN